MDKSRRSASTIMQVVNQTFEHAEMLMLMPGFTEHGTHQNLWGEARLLPLAEPQDDEEPEVATSTALRNPLTMPRIDNSESTNTREGRLIAEQIQRLINESTPIGSDGQARPCRYSDIMLLIRSRTHAHAYETALKEFNIPFLGADRGTLLHTREVQDMVSLLEILTMPFNNLALATCLKSPIFNCDDNDLITLSTQAEKQGWVEYLLADETPTETLSPALQYARLSLLRWRALATHLPIHDLVDQLFHQGDFLARYRSASAPSLRQRVENNLGRFLELALEVDSGRYPTIGRFLRSLNEMRASDGEAPDEANPAAGANAIRIMTIHASKGLEAPVVFLADSARETRGAKGLKALIQWPEIDEKQADRPSHFLLVGKKSDQDPLSQSLLAQQEKRGREEDANLLYVAITRARQLLFVSGSLGKRQQDLGWYGQIAKGWPLDENEEAIVISNDQPPRCTTTEDTATQKNVVVALDWLKQNHDDEVEETASPSQLGEEDSEWQGEKNRQRGTGIHRYLQLLSEEQNISAEAMRNQLAFELNLRPDDPLLEECEHEAQSTFTQSELSNIFDPEYFQRAWNEVPIQFYHQSRLHHGIIDRLIQTDEGMAIIDYKTHRITDIKQAEIIAEHYRKQLQSYANGIRQLWPGQKISAQLLFTQIHTLIPISLDD
jgi:ATP-dependent helicase/nuclease subunit A